MVDWDFRNAVLKSVYELTDRVPGAHHIQDHLDDSSVTPEEITRVMTWLAGQGLIDGVGNREMGGQVRRARISALGSNFVETGESVENLAKAAVQGAIINAQTNYNHAPSTNIMGDNAVVTQNNQSVGDLEKVIAILRDSAEGERAEDLQKEADLNGARAALKKAANWIGTNVLAAPVVAQIAPYVFSGLGM